MAASTVPAVYGTALLELSQERGTAAQVAAACPVVAEAFTGAVVRALEAPSLSRDHARRILAETLAATPAEIRNLALLLLERGRLAALPAILAETHRQFEALHGVQHITVTTASPVTADAQQKIAGALRRVLGPGVRIAHATDRAIIGGMTLRFADTLVDGSVRRSLAEMKHTMLSVPVGDDLWASA